MNPPPNECAAGSLCQGAGKTLGNHYCCRCKKTVHSVFCSKEVDSLEGNIKESFKDDEQKGSFKEVCNPCVEKATNQQPPAAASAVGAARDGADTSAKVQKFKCDGDEFSGVASKFSDLSSTLRLSYKRLESNRVANKQKKAPRQGTLFPFINVRGGSK